MQRLFGGLMLALAMLVTTPAMAQQADDFSKRLALSHRFIELIQADQMGAMIGGMVSDLSPGQMEGMTEAETREFRGLMTQITADMMPRMFDAMAPVYADIFTLEELEGLVAFYESDVGQALIRKNFEAAPRITAEMQAMMPGLMLEMGDRLCDHYECTPDQRREMKATITEAYGTPQ